MKLEIFGRKWQNEVMSQVVNAALACQMLHACFHGVNNLITHKKKNSQILKAVTVSRFDNRILVTV